MIEITSWMASYQDAVSAEFGQRIVCIGLQGSYGRGEATEQSDIDAVLILDSLKVNDLEKYKKAVSVLPYREKLCGFISGRQELASWEDADLFSFYYDTRPLTGDLNFLLPRINENAARRCVLIGACNVYHACCHNFVHENNVELLRSLQKSAFFILRAAHYCRTGQFVSAKADLLPLLPQEEQILLQTQAENFKGLSQQLFDWSQKTIFSFSS